ncbi:MlaD family protein [Haloechinothrix salitolerans]|uniref:MlaD family protein n=1 Tax=Haloechinothrix salitolerans TaxID=926830 RepID=A0ABW2BV19_9PSEU
MKSYRGRLAVVMAMVAIAGVVVAMTSGEEGDDVTVVAMFEDASPIVTGNEVKASGVTVGNVESVTLRDGLARVEMRVERSVLPLYEDASAEITLKDLLGERYIKLARGSQGTGMADDSLWIPVEQTRSGVDLQDILNDVDNPTGTALAALVTTLGEAANNQGEKIAEGIEALAPAMRQTDRLGTMLSEHNELLSRLVDNVEPVVRELADGRGTKLDGLVESTVRTLSAVAAERESASATLRRLPGTLSKAQRTLAKVAGVSADAAPTLASLRPVTSDLRDVGKELHTFADVVDPALASLSPVLERADELLDQAGPLVNALRPAGADLRSVANDGRTLMEQALSKRLGNLMEFVKGWALSTSGYDGLSHYFRASIVTTPKALGTIADGAVPGDTDLSELADGLPKLPGASPTLPGADGDADQGATKDSGATGDGGATGLTEKQERSLLGQLLGGR